jgi:hypothetical protein
MRNASQGRRWPYAAGLLLCSLGGLVLAVVFSIAAVLIRLMAGPEPFEALGVSLGEVLVVYCVAFPFSGLIAGALNQLGATLPGAMALGVGWYRPGT